MRRRTSPFLLIEQLECRDAAATLVGKNRVTYQDTDGDIVTVSFSKPILNVGNVDTIFEFDSGAVNQDNTFNQQLRQIYLTSLAQAAAGLSITSTVRGAVSSDGLAALGEIDATDIDLGVVAIHGDLGRIVAGDPDTTTSGLKGLRVDSLGRFGTTTGAANTGTVVQGRLGYLRVATDITRANVGIQGGPAGTIGSITIGGSVSGDPFGGSIRASGDMGPVRIGGDLIGSATLDSTGQLWTEGKLGSVTIGGSIRGGAKETAWIRALGDIGPVRIGADLVGGDLRDSGRLSSYGGRIASVTVGGSVIGGTGRRSGKIDAHTEMGPVKIGGDLVGSADDTGSVSAGGKLPKVVVSGSVMGGAGEYSARIYAGDLGLVQVGGNLTGGGGFESGRIDAGDRLGGVKIGGSIVGGTGQSSGEIFSPDDVGLISIGGDLDGGVIQSQTELSRVIIEGSVRGGPGRGSSVGCGCITAEGEIGLVSIGGDLIGASASGTVDLQQSGYIGAKRIAAVVIRGSLIAGTNETTGFFRNNGAIRVADDLGSVTVKGSILGNATNPAIVSARGRAAPTATSDVAIGSLRVFGRVEFAKILAGVGPYDSYGVPTNADAQIGSVSVGLDWIASSIAAGVVPGPEGFGTGDQKMYGADVKDIQGIFSTIRSLTIGGEAKGSVGGADSFGIVAEYVSVVKIGGTRMLLTARESNDDLVIGITDDFKVHEV